MSHVEPPAGEEMAAPDVDPELIDRAYVVDELAFLENTDWERAEDWIAEHGFVAAYERVTAYWGAQ